MESAVLHQRSHLTLLLSGLPCGPRLLVAALVGVMAASPAVPASAEVLPPLGSRSAGPRAPEAARKAVFEPVHRKITEAVEAAPSRPNAYRDRHQAACGDACQPVAGGCGECGGRCVGPCVVRPDRFGYYTTRWRTWPGSGVVQAGGVEEMTPVSPPEMVIPSVDEESLPQVDEPPPAQPLPPPPPPGGPLPPGDGGPATNNAPVVPPPAEPDGEPAVDPPRPPAEENLFDEFSGQRRMQERLAVVNHMVLVTKDRQSADEGPIFPAVAVEEAEAIELTAPVDPPALIPAAPDGSPSPAPRRKRGNILRHNPLR